MYIPLDLLSGLKIPNTTRHAAEFWMIEPEIAFADLEDNMHLAEDMIKYIINYIMKMLQKKWSSFNKFIDKGLLDRLNNVVNSEFTRITYTEAIDLLKKPVRPSPIL